jgi:PGF-pre-PGF domain-containing protein
LLALYWQTSVPFEITAQAEDTDGAVVSVTLYYRYRVDNENWSAWKPFGTATAEPWSWEFSPPENDGYYEFHSLATDDDGETESVPSVADAWCGIDTAAPHLARVVINGDASYTTSREVTVEIDASDMTSGLVEMQFSENLENWTEWEPFATERTYTFSEGDGIRHLYVRVRDNAGHLSAVGVDSIELITEAGFLIIPPTGAGENIVLDYTDYEMDVREIQMTFRENVPEGWTRVEEFREEAPENVPALPPNVRAYAYFRLTSTVEFEDIEGLNIYFRVSSAWIKPGEENRVRLFWENVEDKSWRELPATLIKEDVDYFYYSAVAPSPSDFVIAMVSEPGVVLAAPPPSLLFFLVIAGVISIGAFGTFQVARWLRRQKLKPAPVTLARPKVKKVKPKRPPPVIEVYRDILAPAAERLAKKKAKEESREKEAGKNSGSG